MTPVEFPEQNVVFAKDQPEYLPLPAYVTDDSARTVISCWRFTWRERLKVFFGAPLWIRSMTFGGPLQPLLPEVNRPFVKQGGKSGK